MIQTEFLKYHMANPKIYRRLVELARQAKAAGYARYGIKALIEVVRWEECMRVFQTDGWKINNDFTSRYARVIMEREADLVGFFETRELKAA